MEEKLPGPHGIMISHIAMGVGGDMAIMKKNLLVLYSGKTLLKCDLALPKGFYFGPKQTDPRFKHLIYLI